ncbi:MAG: glycosyltransferase family 61 protein [Methylotenera sp.]|nr:glycosyltransferase family 61 protein [Methylotenera sp.]
MIKIRRIQPFQIKSQSGKGLLSFLQNSSLGKVYRRYLKRYSLVRIFVLWVWTRLLPIALLIYGKYKFGSTHLKKLSEYSLNRQVLFRSQLVQLRLPDVFPKNKGIGLNLQTEFEFPEIYVSTINNCIVTGSSNFLNVDEGVICHDLFRSSHDYTSEELHSRFIINSKKSLITRVSAIKAQGKIQEGAVFTDAVSGNYAHFLTEVLPRIFIFSRGYQNTKIPLIIDYGLHPNLMEALRAVVEKNVDLIGLEVGETLLVKSLQVVSVCGYIPFERRAKTENLTDHSDGIFSSNVLCAMRDFIKSNILNTAGVVKHKKIFIKRNSDYRNANNAKDIEDMLIAEGFFVVEPEKLSFKEQVNLFSNAEVLVGVTGAAFANLIFCKPETKIIILISDYKNMIYGYWQNMASAVGNKVTYVIGECADVSSQLHSNFQIDLPDLLDAISG